MSAEVEAYRDAMAAALGLSLSPDSAAGVAANLTVLARMATELDAVALAPEDDPLPVFRP